MNGLMEASIFGDIFRWILGIVPDSAVWAAALIVIGFLAKNLLKPLIDGMANKAWIESIARLADDVTDDLVARLPDAKWDDYLDEAVDKIIDVCGLGEETAKRVAGASLGRKGLKRE